MRARISVPHVRAPNTDVVPQRHLLWHNVYFIFAITIEITTLRLNLDGNSIIFIYIIIPSATQIKLQQYKRFTIGYESLRGQSLTGH